MAENIVCPHCGVTIHYSTGDAYLGQDSDGHYVVRSGPCTSCDMLICSLLEGKDAAQYASGSFAGFRTVERQRLIHPFGSANRPVSPSVPDDLRDEYREAALVLDLSPKASAALSRRCLQKVIREKLGVRGRTLYAEIEEVISRNLVADYLAEQLHNVREIGNNAAHPITTGATGDIVEVEPHEAEWNLDVLDGLFEALYVAPARAAKRKAEFEAKMGRATP